MRATGFVDNYIQEYQVALDAVRRFYTMNRNEINAFALDGMNRQIERARRSSPFYRSHLKDIPKLGSIEESGVVPTITKAILKEFSQDLLVLGPRDILRYGETTGTSDKPLGIYIDRSSYIINSVSLAYLISGIFNSSDIVSISVPYELSFAGLDIDSAFQLLNATIVANGSLSKVSPWSKTLEIIHQLGVTSIVASATRIMRLAMMAEERGLNPANDFALKKLFFTGESVSSSKAKAIMKIWNAENCCNAYGMTETNTLAIQCPAGNFHCLEDRYFYEVVNPDTLQPVKNGEMGELIVSSVNNPAMPLIRYRTGDIVSMGGQCDCGLITNTMKHFGRNGNVLKTGDTAVPAVIIEEILYAIENVGYLAMFEQAGKCLVIYLDVPESQLGKIKEQFILNLGKNQQISVRDEYIEFRRMTKTEFIELIDSSLKPGNSLIKK
ncbi:MAG: AMP-binding protein [Ferruginibacter sp.]